MKTLSFVAVFLTMVFAVVYAGTMQANDTLVNIERAKTQRNIVAMHDACAGVQVSAIHAPGNEACSEAVQRASRGQ